MAPGCTDIDITGEWSWLHLFCNSLVKRMLASLLSPYLTHWSERRKGKEEEGRGGRREEGRESDGWCVRTVVSLSLQVIKLNAFLWCKYPVTHRRQVDHSTGLIRCPTPHQHRQQQLGQQEVTHVVHSELSLQTIRGETQGTGHDSSIVDKNVQWSTR